MTNKRILITGIAGFIGFSLALYLKDRGYFVIGIDNFSPGSAFQLKQDRAHLLQKKGVEIVTADICTPGACSDLIEKHHISHLVHLAALVNLRDSNAYPEAYFKTNVGGFLEVLEACKKRRSFSVRLIYASSAAVYDTTIDKPCVLSDAKEAPATIYGLTKKMNELMASTYHQLYHISAVGLRFFTVYGPWGRPDAGYYTFAESILKKEPINLHNFGKMYRDFIYIDDVVKGIEKSFDIEDGSHLFNLGSGKKESLETLVSIIEKETHKEAQKNAVPLQPGEAFDTWADMEDTRRILQFQPQVDLAKGMHEFVTWYRDYVLHSV